MSSKHRHDSGALIALGMALIAIILTSWFSQPIDQKIQASQENAETQADDKEIDQLVAAIRDFSPWDDTIAQWLMMISAVAGVFVSWKAVVYVRETLAETRRAVSAAEASVAVARQIGNAQLRAYILPNDVQIEPYLTQDGSVRQFVITLTYKNSGQTPGYVFRHDKYLRLVPFDKRLDEIAWSEYDKHPIQHVVPMGSGGTNFFEHQIGPDLIVSAQQNNLVIILYDVIEYRDIVGEIHKTAWCASAKFYEWKWENGKFFIDPRRCLVESHPYGNEAS